MLWYINNNIGQRVAKKEVFNDYHKIWSAREIYGSKKEQTLLNLFKRQQIQVILALK